MVKSNPLAMYSWIYHGFSKEFKLKPVSIILLAIIASYHKDHLDCWHSLASLAQLTGSTQPTVLKHLKELRKIGLIEKGPPHPNYGTTQWGLGIIGVSKFQEIQRIIDLAQRNKHRS